MALFLSPAVVGFNLVYGRILDPEHRWTSWTGNIAAVLIITLTIICYRLYVRVVERRQASELATPRAAGQTVAGIAVGASLVALTTLPIVSLGAYVVVGTEPATHLVHAVFIFAMLSFFEELVFRGVLLRLGEELLGTWISIAVVAVVFGAAHLQHDGATILSSAAIAVQDLVLSAAFVLTRRVWLSWGIHWGWNLAQDGVLGMPNSGLTRLPSWLHPEVTGPTWLTGGEFGIELSLLGVVLSVAAGLVLMRLAKRRQLLVRPAWPITKPG